MSTRKARHDSHSSQLDISQGLVAFGYIPSDFKDETGETLGGIGSAIAIERGTFAQNKDGTFSGNLLVQPDRGYNVKNPIDWQTRFHRLSFTLKPYYGATNLDFAEAAKTLELRYLSTTLHTFHSERTSGADPGTSTTLGNPTVTYPMSTTTDPHLTIDPEGLVQNRGKPGTFWMSDEYGAYIYLLSSKGEILHTIVPPDAVLPRVNGVLNFTSVDDPDSGRSENKGFEGLTCSASGDSLYAMLQSALVQDGGKRRRTSRHTRLFKWNVEDLENKGAILEAAYVVALPQSGKPETYAQSEIHWLNKDQFLVLARDGNGNGDKEPESAYKGIDIIDISPATDISNDEYNAATGAVAPGGQLLSHITPATYVPFIQLTDSVQLARFGLHNGAPVDQTLIAAKWESLALAPACDPEYPDDYFVFTFADNDFRTRNGVSMGKPYDAGMNVDNQAMVWRVTLPTVKRGSVEKSIGI